MSSLRCGYRAGLASFRDRPRSCSQDATIRLRSSSSAFWTSFWTPFLIAFLIAAFLISFRVSNILLPQSNSAASGTTNAQYNRDTAVSKPWYAQELDSEQICRIATLAQPTTANPTA